MNAAQSFRLQSQLNHIELNTEYNCTHGDNLPYKPRVPCKAPGCVALIPSGSGYCTKHKRAEQKRYDKERRPNGSPYNNTRWRQYRKQYLAEHPLCINFDECHNPSTIVDHIYPVNRGGGFWDTDNHQPMCKQCHDRKTAEKDGRWG